MHWTVSSRTKFGNYSQLLRDAMCKASSVSSKLPFAKRAAVGMVYVKRHDVWVHPSLFEAAQAHVLAVLKKERVQPPSRAATKQSSRKCQAAGGAVASRAEDAAPPTKRQKVQGGGRDLLVQMYQGPLVIDNAFLQRWGSVHPAFLMTRHRLRIETLRDFRGVFKPLPVHEGESVEK